jgi:hypothetical protein
MGCSSTELLAVTLIALLTVAYAVRARHATE